jgi:carbon starvation protein
MLGKVYPPFARTNWLPGNLIASLLMVFCWGYFIYTGSVSTIWPMFGAANQLLASIALAVGTSYIINRGKIKYAWITIVPFIFIGFTTVYAGVMNIFNIYLPQLNDSKTLIQGIINLALSITILTCAAVVFYNSIPNWFKAYRERKNPVLRFSEE